MTDLFKLNWRDAAKGLVMAVLASVLTVVYQSVVAHTPIDWNQVTQIAFASGLGYIVKNFFTDSDGKLLGKI